MRAAQRGTSILAALLVVSLVVVIAGSVMVTQERWYRQVKLEGDRLQAMALADAAIDYGRAVLADDRRRNQAVDDRNEAWAQPLPPMSVEGGLLTGAIEELQGRLNLNDVLAHPDPLKNLWAALDLPDEQLDALADWIDDDSVPRFPGGAEDQYYLGIARPYRAANKPLTTIDDLRAVRGVTAQTVARIGDFVSVYPTGSVINVNTASAAVLAAVIPGLGRGMAERLRRSGDDKSFKDAADFADRLRDLGWQGTSVPPVGVTSRYFMVRGEVRWGDASIRMQVAVDRQAAGMAPGAAPKILWKRIE